MPRSKTEPSSLAARLKNAGDHFRTLADRMESLCGDAEQAEKELAELESKLEEADLKREILAQDLSELELEADQLDTLEQDLRDVKRGLKALDEVYQQWAL